MAKPELLRLVEGAGFVFRGRVSGKAPPASLPVAAEGKAISVEVEQIIRSTEVLRRLAGEEVVVLGEGRTAMEEGASFFFFTKVVAMAGRVVVRETGHLRWSHETAEDVAEAVRALEEQPLRRRIAEADLIVAGKVAASRAAETPSIVRSEHDPEWWIARVEVESVVKGRKGAGEIEVLFANSMDIAWHNAPKLHEGTRRLLLLRRVRPEDAAPEAERAVYKATDPLDALPMERLREVERLLTEERRER